MKMVLHQRQSLPSLFAGTDTIVNGCFGISSFRHMSAILKLGAKPPENFNGQEFIAHLFQHIARNWDECLAVLAKPPSMQNWRWFEPKPAMAERNNSPEVTLERKAIIEMLAAGRTDWSNQVPIASGMIVGAGDRRRAIDWVHQRSSNAFDFIELKVNSDNPLYATVELLQYGVIWLLSRKQKQLLGYCGRTLIEADDIRLSVLAPRQFYRSLDLSWLSTCINEGLRVLGEEHEGVKLSFAYETFPEWFSWPGTEQALLPKALDERCRL
jgi:hypothetical protein